MSEGVVKVVANALVYWTIYVCRTMSKVVALESKVNTHSKVRIFFNKSIMKIVVTRGEYANLCTVHISVLSEWELRANHVVC